MAVSSNLAEKFRGCLLGSHIGDCMGFPFELRPSAPKEFLIAFFSRWETVPSMTDRKYIYTDDTGLTLCVANSLIENKGFNATDMAKRFVAEYKFNNVPNRSYGLNVTDVFAALEETSYKDVFEPAKKQFEGSGSFGNGAAMRTAPVALFCYNNVDEMIKLAKEQSVITHTHQFGYNGAILQCLAIHQALMTDSEEKIEPVSFVQNLIEKMSNIERPLELFRSSEDALPYRNSLMKIKDMFQNSRSISPQDIGKILGNDEIAHKSVPTAIYSFLKSLEPSEDFQCSNPYERAMYHAISVGGDTDTIAAMAGAISGAYHGSKIIPENFYQWCETIEKSKEAADRLHDLCCAP